MPSISDTLYIASQIESALTASSLKKITATQKHTGIHPKPRNFQHSGKKPLKENEELTTNEVPNHLDLRV